MFKSLKQETRGGGVGGRGEGGGGRREGGGGRGEGGVGIWQQEIVERAACVKKWVQAL